MEEEGGEVAACGGFDAVADGLKGGADDALVAVHKAGAVLPEFLEGGFEAALDFGVLLTEEGYAVDHILSCSHNFCDVVHLFFLHPGRADEP